MAVNKRAMVVLCLCFLGLSSAYAVDRSFTKVLCQSVFRTREQVFDSYEQKAVVESLLLMSGLPRRIHTKLERHQADPESLLGTIDPVSPGLIFLEPIDTKHTALHEILTARDYAEFLRSRYGRAFVFIASHQGKSVPFFDGVVIDPNTGESEMNISLKFASTRLVNPKVEMIRKNMLNRLQRDHRFKRLKTPDGWFKLANHLGELGEVLSHPEYDEMLRHARLLMNIFGLIRADGSYHPQGYELRTVVDVRDHGISFDYFRSPDVQKMLHELVLQLRDENTTLVLLWNSRRVIEVDHQGVKISE